MDFHSIGIDFTKNPELFADLQNKDDDFLMDIDAKLMKAFRFPFVFFLTCDRAEVIAEGSPEFGALERALSLNPAETSQYRYSVQYAEERLFLLSSGILSPLFGEDTIQGQLLKGLECARLMGTASSALDKLFLMAVSFSKRIHTEMKLRVFDRCIGTEIMKRLEGISSVLIVGSGEWARELASMLSAHFDVSMTLRDIGKTFLVPPGVHAVSYDDRLEAAASADAVISASSGLYHTFEEADYPVLAGRILMDIAQPEDMPSSFNAVKLQDLCPVLPEREVVEKRVRKEAGAEVHDFHEWLAKRDAYPSLRDRAEKIASSSLRRLSSPIAHLTLSADDEKAFRIALSESIRKAVIEEGMSRRS